MTEEPIVESGWERDTLARGSRAYRWWFFIRVPEGRNQIARRGVVDHGFHFARGGRCEFSGDCQWAVQQARLEARDEIALWQHQPSHALGPRGELIPLDEVADEKRRISP